MVVPETGYRRRTVPQAWESGLFGASTGVAPALVADVERPEAVQAVVARRGGRT
ncbi:MAG TPA: hypothetical protein VHJ18_17955 [Streptosporangiaceae bacterium]|nr:hypothetical protein [Streptosporangiaceae bacterium]